MTEIRTPADLPGIDHHGVLVKGRAADGRQVHAVIHKSKHDGIQRCSLDDFARGRRVQRRPWLRDPHQVNVAVNRLAECCARDEPYDPLDHNCQHFPTEVIDGTPRSTQAEFLTGAALLAVVAWAFN